MSENEATLEQPKKRKRDPYKFNKEMRAHYLGFIVEGGLRRQEAAHAIGISPSAVCDYIKSNPEFGDIISDAETKSIRCIISIAKAADEKAKRLPIDKIRLHSGRSIHKEDSFVWNDWISLCTSYENRCLCCGEIKPLAIDHIIPLSKGGTNTLDNLQPLCKSCNSKKRDKTIDYRARYYDYSI